MQYAVPTATPGETGIPLRISDENLPLPVEVDKRKPQLPALQTAKQAMLPSTGTTRTHRTRDQSAATVDLLARRVHYKSLSARRSAGAAASFLSCHLRSMTATAPVPAATPPASA